MEFARLLRAQIAHVKEASESTRNHNFGMGLAQDKVRFRATKKKPGAGASGPSQARRLAEPDGPWQSAAGNGARSSGDTLRARTTPGKSLFIADCAFHPKTLTWGRNGRRIRPENPKPGHGGHQGAGHLAGIDGAAISA